MRVLSAALLLLLGGLARADYQTELDVMLLGDSLNVNQHGLPYASTSSGAGIGLGLALDGGGKLRLSLDYSDFDLSNNNQLSELVFNADQFFDLTTLPALRPYVGVAAGAGRLDLTDPPGLAMGGHDIRPDYGLRLGASYRLDSKWSLELGGRYLYTGLRVSPIAGAELAVQSDSSVWLSLNYRLQ